MINVISLIFLLHRIRYWPGDDFDSQPSTGKGDNNNKPKKQRMAEFLEKIMIPDETLYVFYKTYPSYTNLRYKEHEQCDLNLCNAVDEWDMVIEWNTEFFCL